jgi:KRAB domain-containing zinc finger protein
LRKSNLNQHIIKTHEKVVATFKCSKCEQRFVQRSQLQIHLENDHEEVKPFKCEQCEQAFSFQPNLERHFKNMHKVGKRKKSKKNQTGESDQHPPTGSTLEEPETAVLNGDESACCQENGESPFECQVCSISFTQKCNLTAHTKIVHEKQTTYECRFCQKRIRLRSLSDDKD